MNNRELVIPRRCKITVQKSIDENVNDLEKRVTVIHGDSHLEVSPVTVVKTKDDSPRFFVDYRAEIITLYHCHTPYLAPTFI